MCPIGEGESDRVVTERRGTAPHISVNCDCASYAGVKVHALGCPQAYYDAETYAHLMPEQPSAVTAPPTLDR
jgi:hypothetical protein